MKGGAEVIEAILFALFAPVVGWFLVWIVVQQATENKFLEIWDEIEKLKAKADPVEMDGNYD